MEGVRIPEWLKEEIIRELGDTELVRRTLDYIYIADKGGNKVVFEKFDAWDNHALMFAAHSCVRKAREILERNI